MSSEASIQYMWNPWHGCHKCSEGCLRCYMHEQDRNRGINSNNIKVNKSTFRLPVQKKRVKGKKLEKYELEYKIPSGSIIMTSLTSDFFIEEADIWRYDAWKFIRERQDCLFVIITKRPERIYETLPYNWLDGYDNVKISVSVENEKQAWIRIPILLELPIKHKGINLAPLLENIDIRPFLSSGDIEEVGLAGESYRGLDGPARTLKMSWVKNIRSQCIEYDTYFNFYQTGSKLELENGQIINVYKRDEYELAKFYKLNTGTNFNKQWEQNIKNLELRLIEEDAYTLYKQIELDFS